MSFSYACARGIPDTVVLLAGDAVVVVAVVGVSVGASVSASAIYPTDMIKVRTKVGLISVIRLSVNPNPSPNGGRWRVYVRACVRVSEYSEYVRACVHVHVCL